MIAENEEVFDVYWEGPFEWGRHEEKLDAAHVLYAIYGSHPVYGSKVLLYIGRTENINNRMHIHAQWIEEETEVVEIRVASMGKIDSWEDWEKDQRYAISKLEDVKHVESLLIYAHSPAYNTANKSSIGAARGIRIFNTGRIGSLLPEVSYRYWNEDGEW